MLSFNIALQSFVLMNAERVRRVIRSNVLCKHLFIVRGV